MEFTEEQKAFLQKYAPFAALIGRNPLKPECYILLDENLNVIFQTYNVWNKTGGNYTKEVKEANAKFNYKQELSHTNLCVPDTIENAIEFFELKSKYTNL